MNRIFFIMIIILVFYVYSCEDDHGIVDIDAIFSFDSIVVYIESGLNPDTGSQSGHHIINIYYHFEGIGGSVEIFEFRSHYPDYYEILSDHDQIHSGHPDPVNTNLIYHRDFWVGYNYSEIDIVNINIMVAGRFWLKKNSVSGLLQRDIIIYDSFEWSDSMKVAVH